MANNLRKRLIAWQLAMLMIYIGCMTYYVWFLFYSPVERTSAHQIEFRNKGHVHYVNPIALKMFWIVVGLSGLLVLLMIVLAHRLRKLRRNGGLVPSPSDPRK